MKQCNIIPPKKFRNSVDYEHMFFIFVGRKMTPRPKRNRIIQKAPHSRRFQPAGIQEDTHHEILLLFEEFEAIRLADHMGMTQVQAAKNMNVSRPTFTRIYDAARKKIAAALTESRSLVIEGGHFSIEEHWFRCNDCLISFRAEQEEAPECVVCNSKNISNMSAQETNHAHRQQSSNKGRMGIEGSCICPRCEKKIPHQRGVPCRTMSCPDCHVNLVREGSEHHKAILKKKMNKK